MRHTSSIVSLASLLAVSGMMLATPASAADLELPPPPIVAPVFDWTGFYGGVNIGYGFAGTDRVAVIPPGTIVGKLDLDGVFGGGQLGYNIQTGPWVWGLEGDFQGSGIGDKVSGGGFTAKSDIDWFATIRGRAGWAFDNVLLYGTGGLAIGGIDYSVSPGFSDDYTELGWTAGGGVEYAFNPNMSAKLEYMYLNFGKKTIRNAAGAATRATPEAHTVRLGVNWHF